VFARRSQSIAASSTRHNWRIARFAETIFSFEYARARFGTMNAGRSVVKVGEPKPMKKTALLAFASIVVATPSVAKSHHHYLDHHHLVRRDASHHRGYAERPANSEPASAHARITCEMVRAYVAQVGAVQARAMALSAGMTASDERRAIHCLENGA
jgi:hypothetical protein